MKSVLIIFQMRLQAILFTAALFVLTSPVFAQTPNPDYSALSQTQLQALADSGDMHAVFTQGYNLIFDYEMNLSPNPDFAAAKAMLEKAHEGGHDTANSILMLYYQGDFGHEPDLEALETLLFTSSERGSAIAKLNYAYRYVESEDTVKSDRALQYLKDATQNKVVRETAYPFLIEILYGMNSDVQENLPLARKTTLDCAKLWPEEAYCHYVLARDFANGWGGDADLSKSDVHFRKAAEAGDARAQWQVGMHYLNGDRVEKNEKTAFAWVEKSAEQDYLNGLISFAVMNALGQGTEKNPDLSFKAYEAAAKLGSGHALRALGAMYCAGEAPKTDRGLCAAALILAYEFEDDQAAALLNRFFDISDQPGFEALKKKTAPQRATLINQYDIQL